MAPVLAVGRAGYFYPRSPCGERHNINSSVNTADQISIHALLAESDTQPGKSNKLARVFLSTLSLRRATAPKGSVHDFKLISIHALLAESDRTNLDKFHKDLTFLSTLSLRRATL